MMNKLSKVGAIFGLGVIFVFTWKFLIQTDFTSMWLLGLVGGCTMITFSYIYHWMREIDKAIDDIIRMIEDPSVDEKKILAKWEIEETFLIVQIEAMEKRFWEQNND